MLPQPHTLVWAGFAHAEPAGLPVQFVHEPEAPHAALVVPGAQVPLLQHPPLHVAEVPHAVEHTCVVVALHACPAGQSVEELQPQAPLPRQIGPFAETAQLLQTVPFPPHSVCVFPVWHVPDVVLEQHPVGHGAEVLHVKLQIPPEHPCAPDAQSDTEPHPHSPPPETVSHTCPCVLPVQLLQSAPVFPHAVVAVPAEQVPPLQHPPLQGDVPLHAVVHCPLLPHA